MDFGNVSSSYSQGQFTQDCKFIVLKKLGISLYSILKGNYLNLRKIDILKAGIQMINCVEEFHKLGYVHLDIKVNNLLFGEREHAYNYNSRREFVDLINLEENE